MTVVIFTVLSSACMCTALAIVLPFPLPRTIDEIAVELEEKKPCHSSLHSSVAKSGELQAGARPLLRSRGVAAKHYVRVTKSTVLIIIDWVCSFMTIISVCFLIYDLTAHGFLFWGSIVPLTLAVAFPLLNSFADRMIDLREL